MLLINTKHLMFCVDQTQTARIFPALPLLRFLINGIFCHPVSTFMPPCLLFLFMSLVLLNFNGVAKCFRCYPKIFSELMWRLGLIQRSIWSCWVEFLQRAESTEKSTLWYKMATLNRKKGLQAAVTVIRFLSNAYHKVLSNLSRPLLSLSWVTSQALGLFHIAILDNFKHLKGAKSETSCSGLTCVRGLVSPAGGRQGDGEEDGKRDVIDVAIWADSSIVRGTK